jgi:peptidoglycan/LPS O-acetylase OafA/YrhL
MLWDSSAKAPGIKTKNPATARAGNLIHLTSELSRPAWSGKVWRRVDQTQRVLKFMNPSSPAGTDVPGHILQNRLPSLDGWRALSILLVLGNHEIFSTGFPHGLAPAFHWLFDGSLGVRFFFTISGFLITWLLLQEWRASQHISLRNFYVRRCLRILPVYFAFLLTIYVLQHTVGNVRNDHSWAGCLTFTRNVFGTDGISSHLWSLSIEEQFYLLWPSTLLLLLTKGNIRSLLVVILFVVLLAPLSRGAADTLLLPQYPTTQLPETALAKLGFFGILMVANFFAFADSLAFGCLAAILMAHKGPQVRAQLTTRPQWTAAIAGACILAPYILDHLPQKTPIICAQFSFSLQAIGFSIFLLQSILLPQAAAYRVLNWKPVVQLGILSYSIYIWQQLVWIAPKHIGLDHIWWMGLWIPPLLALSALSYYAMERPLTRLRTAFRPKIIA